MGLESGNTIEDLNANWPRGSDPKSEGDDHLRLLKTVLKNDVVPASKGGTFKGPIIINSATGVIVKGDVDGAVYAYAIRDIDSDVSVSALLWSATDGTTILARDKDALNDRTFRFPDASIDLSSWPSDGVLRLFEGDQRYLKSVGGTVTGDVVFETDNLFLFNEGGSFNLIWRSEAGINAGAMFNSTGNENMVMRVRDGAGGNPRDFTFRHAGQLAGSDVTNVLRKTDGDSLYAPKSLMVALIAELQASGSISAAVAATLEALLGPLEEAPEPAPVTDP